MSQNTLVFGGAGFIGTNLVEFLQNTRHGQTPIVFDNFSMQESYIGENEPHIIRANMTDYVAVESALQKFRPETIYHLVANSDISASALHPELDLDNTLATTATLVSALRNLKSLKPSLVFASTSAVYQPSEEMLSEESPTVPISSYGWMKLASERLLANAVNEGVINKVLVARFPNVTGRYQTHGVVYDLARKLKASAGAYLEVLGDGSQEKPYILASELVQKLEQVISSQWSGLEIANFGPSTTATVREITQVIVEESGYSPEVKFGTTPFGWVGDVPKYRYSTKYAESHLGIESFGTSQSSVREAVRWALANLS